MIEAKGQGSTNEINRIVAGADCCAEQQNPVENVRNHGQPSGIYRD